MEDLYSEILKNKMVYRTDSYAMSIGELMNMYQNNELITNPIYQREFRWSEIQKSRFIESILLEIPLPSVFIYQDRNKWEVVDGLQRLSTIFQFTGILKDNNKNLVSPFKIEDVKTLKILNNKFWEEFDDDIKFDFRRVKIEIKIIKDNTPNKSKAKFEVFQRINQRPSILSGQEFRNALLIMYDENIFFWLERLSKFEYFKNCISGLGERWINEQYDKELVLRLFIFSNYDFKSKFNKVDDYLDNSVIYNEEDSLILKIQNKKFDLINEELKFNKTFKLLYLAKGEDVFKKNSSNKGQQFLESYFEAIAIGLYYNIDFYNETENDIDIIKNKIDRLDEQQEFEATRGVSINTETRIRKLIPFSKKFFKKDE